MFKEYTRRIFGVLLILPLLASQSLAQSRGQSSSARDAPYRLGVGDEVDISVFDEEDLSTRGIVSDSGTISLPLIGPINLEGVTLKNAERRIVTTLANGYLINPKVTISVLNYRPFYVLGEVKNSGVFEYSIGITVLNAVALAGGFSNRADRDDIVISRKLRQKRSKFRVTSEDRVQPGDIIEIGERFF